MPTTAWMKEVDPDIRRNDNLADRRLILIVLDDAQVPPTNLRIAENVKKAGRAIIDQLGPSDLAAVIYTMDSRQMQEFTTDRAKLLAAIDRFTPGFGGDQELFERYSVGTLQRASEFLAEIPQRRKAMFYISTGVNVDLASVAQPVRATAQTDINNDQVGRTANLMQEMQEVFRQAQIANVNISAIDPSALEGIGGGGSSSPRKDFLFTVSESTGGTPIINSDNYQASIGQVFLENSAYYLVGYEPSAPNDGKFHGVEVKVNRPGLIVRARSGYYAPDAVKAVKSSAGARPGPSPLWKAISGLLPVGDLPLQVMAAPFANPIQGKKEATVAIALGIVQDVDTGPERQTEHIEFLVDAFGQDGSSKSAHGLKADIVLKPNVKGKVGYEVLTRIDLKPGRYQLRLSAHLPSQDKSGSIYYDVDVPDFSKGALALSGVMMSVTPALVAAPRDRLADLMPIVPTTNRYFNGKTDAVTAFIRVYQPKGGLKPVILRSRLTDSTGAVVLNREATIPIVTFGGNRRAASWRFAVPVAGLKPGAYLLTFDASVGTTKASRDIRFVVQ